MSVPVQLRAALATVVERIAAGDYRGLKRDGIDPHPTADLSLWIRNYRSAGVTITPLPEAAWESADAVPVTGRPGTWAVAVPLWTIEEGMSDLSMEATVSESANGVSVVIDDIRVL